MHTVQLFDDPTSRSEAIAGFVRQGLEAGDAVLVVATREHWELATARLWQRGLRLDADIASYRLKVSEAALTLSQFMRGRTLDRDLFDQTVGARIRLRRTTGVRLRVYGEMVDLLAQEGDFANVLRLEGLWNDALQSEPVDLLCGYSATSFGDPQHRQTLSRICHAHTHVRCSPYDRRSTSLLESNWTVADLNAAFPADQGPN